MTGVGPCKTFSLMSWAWLTKAPMPQPSSVFGWAVKSKSILCAGSVLAAKEKQFLFFFFFELIKRN